MSQPKAYLEHVAFWVRDIQWHIRFFSEVCGMTMREMQGDAEQPVRVAEPGELPVGREAVRRGHVLGGGRLPA